MVKYTLNLDNQNYVLSIAHTENDNIELDLSQYEHLKYLSAYQYLGGNELVLDETKLAQLIAEEEQERTPTWDETIEAQATYTALVTDTLLESEA